MTSYEQGFLTKCAEYGIDGRQLLEKRALDTATVIKAIKDYGHSTILGSILGATTGYALTKKKKKANRNMLIGALLGGLTGGGVQYGLSHLFPPELTPEDRKKISDKVDEVVERERRAIQKRNDELRAKGYKIYDKPIPLSE